ncbi:MAG: tetratricopeptide (TPR) repeat protein [Myxococcota bacterium]
MTTAWMALPVDADAMRRVWRSGRMSHCALLMSLLVAGSASAAVPLPDYERELARARWHEANDVLEAACRYEPRQRAVVCTDRVDDAIELAESFQRHVFADAGLTYLVALAQRYKGDEPAAAAGFRRALALDDAHDAAWHDLGELLLISGDFDDADAAFAHVTALRKTGPNAWVGPWRQAEVAAHQRQVVAFEEHMRQALRRGFSFRTIAGLPNWKSFYADPVMRKSITKLVTVYGDPELLGTLEPTAELEP